MTGEEEREDRGGRGGRGEGGAGGEGIGEGLRNGRVGELKEVRREYHVPVHSAQCPSVATWARRGARAV